MVNKGQKKKAMKAHEPGHDNKSPSRKRKRPNNLKGDKEGNDGTMRRMSITAPKMRDDDESMQSLVDKLVGKVTAVDQAVIDPSSADETTAPFSSSKETEDTETSPALVEAAMSRSLKMEQRVAKRQKRQLDEEAKKQATLAQKKAEILQKREKEKERKERLKLRIGGKLRGSEGPTDIAFLEWLLVSCRSVQGVHELWNKFIEDWNALPEEEDRPRTAHRPANLFSQFTEVKKKKGYFRKAIAEGRKAIPGLRPSETVLCWLNRERAVHDGVGVRGSIKDKQSVKRQSVLKQYSGNPFDLLDS